MPRQVWLAIGVKDWQPRTTPTAIRFVRLSGAALAEGISTHVIENVPVPIFEPAKTVADCFKFRNKIGTDVAVEALRDCLGNRRATVEELLHFACICRVKNVMRPYQAIMTRADKRDLAASVKQRHDPGFGDAVVPDPVRLEFQKRFSIFAPLVMTYRWRPSSRRRPKQWFASA
jgi:hypothetical protein